MKNICILNFNIEIKLINLYIFFNFYKSYITLHKIHYNEILNFTMYVLKYLNSFFIILNLINIKLVSKHLTYKYILYILYLLHKV